MASSSQLSSQLCVAEICIKVSPFTKKWLEIEMDKPKHKNKLVINIKSMKLLTTPRWLTLLPIIIISIVLIAIRRYPFPDDPPFPDSKGFQISENPIGPVSGEYSYLPQAEEDELLAGLLATNFEEKSCLSRYRSASYHKPSLIKRSSHLKSKLRSYEAFHRRCGPHTKSYNKTVKLIKAGQSVGPTDCNYLVWASFGSIQNRLLSLASAFLYALLTNRVLLVDRGKGISVISDLLCEPFPNVSWLLPLDFPVADKLNSLHQNSSHSYGYLVKNNILSNSKRSFPAFIYLHLVHDYDDHDKLFFCDQDQGVLQKSPWLIMKTDNYFVPSLFLIPSFEQELNRLFPQKEYVFHYLGRYLFHPSNEVWRIITKYDHHHLENADEKVGIQIETFNPITQPFSYVMDQILACTLNEKILPRVTKNQSESANLQSPKPKSIAVLVSSSSNSGYYENLKSMYEYNPTINGETVSIHHVRYDFEEDDDEMITENMKLWAEMFLLSLTDVLITSSGSTFGYVAHSLRGWTPWILLKPESEFNDQKPSDLYRVALSIEPCFQTPPLVDCNSKNKLYSRSVVDHVRYCEDMIDGIKLVDGLSDDIS